MRKRGWKGGVLFLTAASLIVLAGCKSPADRVVGTWNGSLDLGAAMAKIAPQAAKTGAKLRLVCTFEKKDKGLSGTLQSPDQSPQKINLDSVSVEGDTVKFQANSLYASYEGKLSSDGSEITGNFKQGQLSMPLTLKKGS